MNARLLFLALCILLMRPAKGAAECEVGKVLASSPDPFLPATRFLPWIRPGISSRGITRR